MSRSVLRCVPISDFNTKNFIAYLENDEDPPRIDCLPTDFGQVNQVLLDEGANVWQQDPDLAIVWTRPQAVIHSFDKLIEGHPVSTLDIRREVEGHAQVLRQITRRVPTILVALWAISPERRNHAVHNLGSRQGVDRILMEMNTLLLDSLSDLKELHFLNTPSWIATVGKEAFSPKLWHLAKIPYSNSLFQEAAAAVKSAIRGLAGGSKKLIVVDLDNTLWGGIVGDDGKENLRLGGHDAAGEAFVDFQRELLYLTRRGVLLAIVSKNEESVALDAIQSHPEMILDLDTFASWRIDWQDKASNLVALVQELNLGLDSVVFLDDSPVERDRVRTALPEVEVPEWPDDPAEYARALRSLGCFNLPNLTDEDRTRSGMYTAQRKRSAKQISFDSVDTWLSSLDTMVECEPLDELNLARTTQLLNKTNQMNMTTRRMSESEFREWAQAAHHEVWTFRVADKMGDLGLTGILSLEIVGKTGRIVDFVLSCRVMGRKIEETMISRAYMFAKESGLTELCAEPIATKKNMPCLRFWNESGFETSDQGFRWSTDREYPTPDQVRLIVAAVEVA